jgi:RNA polymerase I specific initiation factor
VQTDDEDTEIESRQLQQERKAPHLRIQHLGVLTTILHRCLLEGDIPRASRAWAMLLRAQVNGKGINIRSSGYWGIGAELLIRSGEKPARERRAFREDEGESSESDAEDSGDDDEAKSWKDAKYGESERWGTAYGLEKAKDYYERLILQHPYKRQYHDSVNSLDFWPAMLSCEIYGIQFEQKEALRKLTAEEESDDVVMADISSEEGENATMDDPDAYFAARERRETHQREIIWKRREEIRQTALVASEKIAARMDELMTTPPFSDSHVLQRLRGMLALFIGDLSVPALFQAEGQDSEDLDESDGGRRDRWAAGGERLADRRLLERQRRAEHERGLAKQAEEVEKARKAFEKIQKDGGRIGVEMGRIV